MQVQLHISMRIKHTILIVISVALFIIERENKLLSRLTKKVLQEKLLIHKNFYSAISKMKSSQSNHSKDRDTTAARGEKHVLLFTTTRTGSSFVGEFFNQNGDNMFYLFEPLWHVERRLTLPSGNTNATATAKAYVDVLRQLFLCDFSLLEHFIQPPPVNHITSNFFRRWSSSSLCEESVCSPGIQAVHKSHKCQIRSCGPLNLTAVRESCLKKERRVIKTVRVHRFNVLQPLAQDPHLDVRFIQLVRDPRAVLASRMVAFPEKMKSWHSWARRKEGLLDDQELTKLKVSCNTVKASAELGLSRPPWLRRRYMLVRYEDVARFPVRKAEEMYWFAGIPFTSQVKSWILKNTQASQEDRHVYSTQKNSSEQAEKWRFTLPFKIVQVVQEICEPTIRLFGYKLVTSEQMLKNKAISLIEDGFNFM